MKPVALLSILVGIVSSMPSAYAVCLDPKTFISGYKLPFDEELESSVAIVVAEITGQENVNEDSSDPEDVTAVIYTVEVLRQLKGSLPSTIEMRAEADSGRYGMRVGEQHVLFLQREENHFIASGCGNSSQLPAGNEIVTQVEIAMLERENAP